MTRARYQFVLFDADNTLFDFDLAEHKALVKSLAHWGYPTDEATQQTYLAINRALWAGFDRGEVSREELVIRRFARLQEKLGGRRDPAEMNRFYLTALGEGSDLLPGAEELCRALAPHCILAIVTNGLALAQRSRFAGSALSDVIGHVFISEAMGCQKPQKEYFDKVCAALNITDRTRAVVVGDNLHSDILGGINAGIDTIWYDPKGRPGSADIVPTHRAADFDALRALLLIEENN